MNDADSTWISGLPEGNAIAVYETTFSLTGFDISTAFLDLTFGVDNGINVVLIIGISTGFQLSTRWKHLRYYMVFV